MRLLIYGAGVIGSLYGLLFKKAGFEVSIFDRGDRLDVLNSKGLLYYENNKLKKIEIKILHELKPDDSYDYIFLAVRENQLYDALNQLKDSTGNIVTMVNSIDNYCKWEDICGKGRIIPAFPGAGGSIKNNILDAALTPRIIQPTTFGEINGENTARINRLERIFKKAKIPCQIVEDMHLWQLCHLAMVVPIADAYYEAKCPERAGHDYNLMLKVAKQLKKNIRFMKIKHGKVSPPKMNIFLYIPAWMLAIAMSIIFRSSFGHTFMYQHSMKAQDEMRSLHEKLYTYMQN
ncbi:MAG: 2-dehydropantoate 2-reductase N-terminal domain-containing protein [Tissierellia bacterium]|nr:2-dehydropantoate 2-reductase N-terminal domain-containing protein [Tissierellia bacterium]